MNANIPATIDDELNQRILTISEDRINGFHESPLAEVSRLSGVAESVVRERIVAMLQSGAIRRVRQTLMTNNLATGALVAWLVAPERLNEVFDWLCANDPFCGHVVIRSTDAETPGSQYRLWTTLKVPQGFSMDKHCQWICQQTGAERFLLMPAKRLFALGVGHMRRRGLQPGAKADRPVEPIETHVIPLSTEQWNLLEAMKREFAPEELLTDHLWQARANEAGLSLQAFLAEARKLDHLGIIGRFSTFLEHVKPLTDGQRVTRFNGLFHWAVPPGMEIRAGSEVGRFHVMTHAYWRDGGPEFNHVNIMGVAHGTEKDFVLAHKRAIDAHLKEQGIPVTYTNVFWGGRSEVKPSEIMPQAYGQWCRSRGIDPAAMRE